jgi:hypothetical protein
MKFLTKAALVLLLAGVFFVGCKSAHDDDHLDINGFQILLNNEIVAQQTGTTVTGVIQIEVGATAGPMLIQFRDPEGAILTISDSDFQSTLGSSNTSVVNTTRIDRFSFSISGVSAGTAQLTVSLEHGGHKDYEARPVTVNVVSVTAE